MYHLPNIVPVVVPDASVNSYMNETCIFVSPGKMNVSNIDAVCGDDVKLPVYVYSSRLKYTTRPMFIPSANSLLESNNTSPPLTAKNDDAVTSPSAVKKNPLDEISKLPLLPEIYCDVGSPRKNVSVCTSNSDGFVEYRK